MGLENATYISGLNASNPVTGDDKTQGDDHLRLIKSTLQATFPNISGAVTPTHTKINETVSFLQAGTGAVARDAREKMRERISVKDFGAVGDGVANDTSAINLALTYAKSVGGDVFCPSGIYKINATLTVPGGVGLIGEGWQPYVTYGVPATPGKGTFISVEHTATPAILIQKDGSNRTTGSRIVGIAMKWAHSAPGGGWTPTVYDWAIKVDQADDVLIEDVLLVNPYKGIQITGTLANPAGRLNVSRVFGQPFLLGLDIDFAADASCIDRVHFWPYWSDNANVLSWMKANNATCIKSSRNDNAQISNIFGYGYARGLHISSNASGTTSRILVNNVDFDDTVRAFWVDSTAAASSGSIANFHATANPATSGADLFVSEADGVDYQFANLRLSNSQKESILVTGNNAQFRISNFWADTWNILAAGHAAVNCGTAARVTVNNGKFTSGSSGPYFAGSGSPHVETQWEAWTPTVTAGSGTFTSASANGRWRLIDGYVHFQIDVAITTNGSAATNVQLSMPAAAFSGGYGLAFGRAFQISGKQLQAYIAPTSSTLIVWNFDGTYPGATGEGLRLQGFYRVVS